MVTARRIALSFLGALLTMVLIGTAALAADAADWHSCPQDYFCFYQNVNFNGRRLEFRDCGYQRLVTYGFDRQTSSWVNRTKYTVDVYDGSGSFLWEETPLSLSSWVGDGANDRADLFAKRC